MTAIAFVFAWLLAALTGGPAPAVPPAPAVHVVAHADEAHAPGRHPGAWSSPRIGGTSPSPRPAAPTIAPAPGTYVNPGQWLDSPEPTFVQPQLPDETIGRALG